MGVKYIEDINDEAMDQWIKDLRSGEYTQTTGMLFRGSSGGMCCLGVQAVGQGATVNAHTSSIQYEGKTYYHLPPKETIASLNLPKEYIDFVSHLECSIRVDALPSESTFSIDGKIGITTLNDESVFQLDFNEIADRLESTFLRDEYKS